MAQAVVDDLELVEIDVEEREPVLGIAVGAGQAVRQAVRQQAAVGEAGERVVQRLEAQLLLGQLAIGDVGERAGGPQGVALRVLDGDAPAEHPAVLAVAVADAKLRRQVLHVLVEVHVEMHVDVGAQPRQIVGVHAIEPFGEPVADLRLVVPQHRLPPGRVVDAAGLDVPVPEPVVGPLGGERVAILGALALLHLGHQALVRRRQSAVALVELVRRELHGPLDELPVIVLLLVGVAHRLQQTLELGPRLAAEVFPQLTLQQSVHVRHAFSASRCCARRPRLDLAEQGDGHRLVLQRARRSRRRR